MTTAVQVGSRTIEITHPDKIYFPNEGRTKFDLVEYYRRVADVMLPFVRSRPATLHRFPDGLGGDGFYQQHRPDSLPDFVEGAELPKREGGSLDHIVINDAASLIAVANTGCITPHVWLSRIDKPEHPDQIVFDLDPPRGVGFSAVVFAARAVRTLLDEVGLAPLVKTTGSRGLHVIVPLRREHDFDQVRDFCRRAAELLSAREPDRLTTEQRVAKRGGRLYLDIQRNAYGQHAVAPYAVRALPGAPVATPLAWSELEKSGLDSQRYRIDNIFRRLGQRNDPWKGAWRHARNLDQPDARLRELETERST